MSNIQKGKYGENLASKYLADNGYKIVETNYKYSKYGEIDIIALDKDLTLCFVEVKTRTNSAFGTPLEAITPLKLSKIYKSMLAYTQKTPLKHKGCRIDAISIEIKNDKPEIIHIKNIEF